MKRFLKAHLILSLIILASCNSSSKTRGGNLAESEPCHDDGDCQKGLVCRAEICRKMCTNDNDCNRSTQHCENEVCLPGSSIKCGNGLREEGEACDDGNKSDGDGCSQTCTKEEGYNCVGAEGEKSICTPKCGNGQIDTGEFCDDNNNVDGDGCSKNCTTEEGWRCENSDSAPTVCTPKCGDGFKLPVEGCDDGNDTQGDGCASCQIEPGFMCEENSASKSSCTCAEGYFGPTCQPCPGVVAGGAACFGHGSCNDGVTGDGACECKEGYDGASDCAVCFPGYDGASDCVVCLPGYDEASDCALCLNPAFDPQKGCVECLNYGFDPQTGCTQCLSGYYSNAGGCNECIKGDNYDPEVCTYTDTREGQNTVYPVYKIVDRFWLGKNMDFDRGTHHNPGDEGSIDDDNIDNVATYGLLYDWASAMIVCPSADGWRLPTKDELETLKNLGPIDLRAESFRNGLDTYGFGALGAGRYSYNEGYQFFKSNGYFWSATELKTDANTTTNAFCLKVPVDPWAVTTNHKHRFLSVRCLRNVQ